MPPVENPNPAPEVPVLQPMPVEPAGKPSSAKAKQAQMLLIGVGVLAVILLITTLVYASKASTTQANLDAQYAQGVTDGKKSQSEADMVKYNKETTSSTRTYEAPVKDGSFQVSYPKAWNLSIDSSSTTPVSGLIDPSFVSLQSPEHALRFTLIATSYEMFKKRQDDLAKNSKGATKVSAITVSGIAGQQYVGTINDKSKTAVGTLVIVPLRDKTMLIQTDNNKLYADTFKAMLDSSKLIP